MREYDDTYPEPSPSRSRRRRFDDDEPRRPHPRSGPAAFDGRSGSDPDGPPEGDRWSTWDGAAHGPGPRPAWVVTEHAAVDTELRVIKTGKEADVHLLERSVPGTDRRTLLAAERYRSTEHRLFHRDAGYLEGRRVRRSREMRAMANRTPTGRPPRGSPSCARTPTSSVTSGTSSSTRCWGWPATASRTATCRPTTCWCTTAGWC